MMGTRCPKCQSLRTYYRIKADEFICQACGNQWAENEKLPTPSEKIQTIKRQ